MIEHPQPFVSHKAHIEVLAWHQPADARSGTFLSADVARDLVGRLAAERISQGKIRMVSPDSVYMAGRTLSLDVKRVLDGLPLPPAEIGNCKFVPPATEHNPLIARVHVDPLLIAAPTWDWTMEPATA